MMLTAQTEPGVRRVQSGVPCVSKARRDQSVPITKRSPFGWIARLRDSSYSASRQRFAEKRRVVLALPAFDRQAGLARGGQFGVGGGAQGQRSRREVEARGRSRRTPGSRSRRGRRRPRRSGGRTGRRNPPPVPDAASEVCRPAPTGRARGRRRRPAGPRRAAAPGSSPFAARPAERVVHPRRRRPRQALGCPPRSGNDPPRTGSRRRATRRRYSDHHCRCRRGAGRCSGAKVRASSRSTRVVSS